MTGQDEFGTERQAAVRAPAPNVVRATSSSARGYAANDAVDDAPITAELPTAAGGVRRGPSRGPASDPTRREPAPVPLQIFVWLLVFALLVVALGDVAVKTHPDWLSFLRNTGPSANTPVAQAPTTSTPAESASWHLVGSPTAASATYAVPAPSYELNVLTTERCYIVIEQPPQSGKILTAEVLPASSKPTVFAEHGSVSVVLDAQATLLSVAAGGRTLGTIHNPKVVPYTYIFQSTT